MIDLEITDVGDRVVASMNIVTITDGVDTKEVRLIGLRHWDKLMHEQLRMHCKAMSYDSTPSVGRPNWYYAPTSGCIQGFVTNRGDFLTREEAHKLAWKNDQVIRRCGSDDTQLFSENLY